MRIMWQIFNKTNTELNLDECGIEEFQAGQRYTYNAPQHFVIHLVQKGRGQFTVDGQTHALVKNQGFIVRKGQTVEYVADQKDPWCTYWLGLSGQQLDQLLQRKNKMQEGILTFDPMSQAADLIYQICDKIRQGDQNLPSDLWLNYKTNQFLYYFSEEFRLNESSQTQANHIFEQKDYALLAQSYLMSNYTRDMKITELADFIGLSRSHLYRVFTEKYQQSPQQYLQSLRLEMAEKYLVTTDLPIKEIAAKIGYKDQLFFSRTFKKHTGRSPTAYRKRESPKTLKKLETGRRTKATNIGGITKDVQGNYCR